MYKINTLSPICQNFIGSIQELEEKSILSGYSYDLNKPWGRFFCIYEDSLTVEFDNFKGKLRQEKILIVDPDTSLTLQRHKFKDELWTPLTFGLWAEIGHGVENCTLINVTTNESLFIQRGSWHRIINKSKLPLIIHEIQFGICDENDVERFNN